MEKGRTEMISTVKSFYCIEKMGQLTNTFDGTETCLGKGPTRISALQATMAFFTEVDCVKLLEKGRLRLIKKALNVDDIGDQNKNLHDDIVIKSSTLKLMSLESDIKYSDLTLEGM